jgi:dolichol-phosphate mannosyltransferase
MKLSIIIPVFNEEKTILSILNKLKKCPIGNLKKEIIIVDDFSSDNTKKILKKIRNRNIKILYHERNMGKGFAIRTALKHFTGDILIIQDADLEYDPGDYKKLLEPILSKKAEVVYGSRFIQKKNKQKFNKFYIANKILSEITSILYPQKITDMETCYKVFRRDIIKKINLKCKRFDFEPEITAKILKKRIKILEVPINYHPRSKKEGKKIGWDDGFVALWALIKYRFID